MTQQTLQLKFDLAEAKGRDIALYIFRNIILPEGWKIIEAPKKRTFDLIIYDNELRERAVVEVKYRNCSSEKYDNAILTDGKYDRLINYKLPSFYCAIYNDGNWFIWNCRKTKPKTEYHYCKAITILSDAKTTKKCDCFEFKDAKYKGKLN